jgi:hypothetical protein
MNSLGNRLHCHIQKSPLPRGALTRPPKLGSHVSYKSLVELTRFSIATLLGLLMDTVPLPGADRQHHIMAQ